METRVEEEIEKTNARTYLYRCMYGVCKRVKLI